jgi:cell division septation protein DedD
VRVANASPVAARRARGTGSVLGTVYADWNGNAQLDPGEEALAGIPIALGTLSHVTTARDGQFAFLNAPAGTEHVRLDLNALPVDFDPPEVSDVTVDLSRGDTRHVTFGLIPLGAVHGRIVEDANRNQQPDPGEPVLASAVLTLDGGQRTELARNGSFRFDAVRAGGHRLELLRDSLPEGAVIVGPAERPVSISHEQSEVDVTYVVTIEKRPEVRKVFPPRGGGGGGGAAATTPSTRPGSPATLTRPGGAPAGAAATKAAVTYTVQIAALQDASRARALVQDLDALGFAAYVLTPDESDAGRLYRVRVGRYATRAAAARVARSLEARLGLKLWVARAN